MLLLPGHLAYAHPTAAHSRAMGDDSDLPLFTGPHIPRIRFERALERLDFRAAAPDAPREWRSAVEGLAAAVDRVGGGKSPDARSIGPAPSRSGAEAQTA